MSASAKDFTLSLVGSGGAGVIVTGEILLKAAGLANFFGIMRKSLGPQIRGGESAAILRLSKHSVQSFLPEMQLLVALDWKNFSRFQDEIIIDSQTVIICDENHSELPQQTNSARQIFAMPFTNIAKQQGSSRINMVVLGFIGALLELPLQTLMDVMSNRLQKKGSTLMDSAVNSIKAGYYCKKPCSMATIVFANQQTDKRQKRWLLSGNEAIAYGALNAGVRFVSAYPITPASEALEWLAQHIGTLAGRLVQAEDELAAVNMAIGAAFGGVPSLTVTSGPGLSLMSEALGLAVASEIPVVVIDVMRGGPSTGIPTKSEQSDLNLAVYGMHGDAPHIVIAPQDIEDCVLCGSWALYLAEALQTVVIVLSDQFLGQSKVIINEPEQQPCKIQRLSFDGAEKSAYLRYRNTDNGISAMALPGQADGMYTADGLEHNEKGTPSPKAGDHKQQLDKRSRKIEQFDYGAWWGTVKGKGTLVLVCWGSVSSAAKEAHSLLADKGISIKLICLRLLNPLPLDELQIIFEQAERIIVIEQNHSAQFFHLLKSRLNIDIEMTRYVAPGPIPINASDIISQVRGEVR